MKIAYRPNYRTLVSPTKGPQTLSAGSSTLAMLLAVGGVMALTATPAMAACNATAPTTGQTVTCDTSPPNPETNGIVTADGSFDIQINILPGAILETTGGPALSIGTGTYDRLDNQGVIRTVGDNAPAILIAPNGVQGGGNATVLTKTRFGVVQTTGNDSAGIVFGEIGGSAGGPVVGSFVMVDTSGATVTTTGDRSPGYVFSGMGTGAGDAFIGFAGHSIDVSTTGHDSAGVIFNAWGNGVTQEVLFVDFAMTANTVGDRSPGVIFGANPANAPGTLVSSFQSTDTGFYVTTQGDDSVGLIFGPSALPSGQVNFAAVAFGGNVVTSGNNSHGVIITEGLSNAQPGGRWRENMRRRIRRRGSGLAIAVETSPAIPLVEDRGSKEYRIDLLRNRRFHAPQHSRLHRQPLDLRGDRLRHVASGSGGQRSHRSVALVVFRYLGLAGERQYR